MYIIYHQSLSISESLLERNQCFNTNLMLKMMTVMPPNYCLFVILEEWLKLNARIIGEEDQVDEQTIRILAAHRAKA